MLLSLNETLDMFDRKILKAVNKNARITISELSKKVGLSKTPCHARLKRLEEDGYILGYRALVDPVKLGLDHVAFVEVKLNDTTDHSLAQFNASVKKVAAIEQCHMIAGGFDYLLKVRTSNIANFRRLLGETLAKLPNVSQTSSYLTLDAVKESAALD